MRFSENGLYIEQYIKCANCGILIYDKQPPRTLEGKPFCSDWCVEWSQDRARRRNAANAKFAS